MRLGVAWAGGGGQGPALGGRRGAQPSCAGLPLSLGGRGVGAGLLFWPGAFLSIFTECKRSFLFYFVFL